MNSIAKWLSALVLAGALSACGGSGSDGLQTTAPECFSAYEEPGPTECLPLGEFAALAGYWQSGERISSSEAARIIAGNGEILWVSADLLSDGFVVLTVNEGAHFGNYLGDEPPPYPLPEYSDTYTGYLELDGDGISGRLNYRGLRWEADPLLPTSDSKRLVRSPLGFGEISGVVLDDRGLSLVIDNGDRSLAILLALRPPELEERPVTELAEFVGVWSAGLDANLETVPFMLDFNAGGTATGSLRNVCAATARLTPMRAGQARIELATTGCDEPAEYVGVAEVSCCVTNHAGGSRYLTIWAGNADQTLPPMLSQSGPVN